MTWSERVNTAATENFRQHGEYISFNDGANFAFDVILEMLRRDSYKDSANDFAEQYDGNYWADWLENKRGEK